MDPTWTIDQLPEPPAAYGSESFVFLVILTAAIPLPPPDLLPLVLILKDGARIGLLESIGFTNVTNSHGLSPGFPPNGFPSPARTHTL